MTSTLTDTGRSDQLRLGSGIERLDEILRGGFVRGGTYALLGPSGSGKTIMANQICSAHIARDDGRCVYVSLLVESHARLIAHLESMRFFRREFIPDKLFYINGYQSLRSDGLPGLLRLLRSSVQERNATILVVDGLESVRTAASSEREFGEFIHQLQAFTGVADCTMFLASLAQPNGHDSTERVLADGVIELDLSLFGPRAIRELHVSKFRGSAHLLGKHQVTISDAGMRVHPRTELRFASGSGAIDNRARRMGFGISGLDAMMGGGIRPRSVVALLGTPGAGKSALGLSFLAEGARQGQPALYVGWHEAPDWLIEKGDALGLALGRYVADERIHLLWRPPVEAPLDEIAELILAHAERNEGAPMRLFIDGLDGFRMAAVYRARMASFLPMFFNRLRVLGVTTVVANHLATLWHEPEPATAELVQLADGIIRLRRIEQHGRRHRVISVLKMRDSEYDDADRELRIRSGGIEVVEASDNTEQDSASGRRPRRAGAESAGPKRRGQ